MSGSNNISEEAAAWAVRLSATDVGEADWLAFLAWLDAGPSDEATRRRAAFDRAQSVWLVFDGVEPPAAPRRATFKPIGRAAWAPLAAAALLVGVLGVWTLSRPRPQIRETSGLSAAAVAYVTAVGQNRAIRLADGSRIEMDGATAMSVGLDAAGRHVALSRGEASFDVIHDPAHPFTVDLGSATVRVLGTAFDIEREGGSIKVAVARGAVSLQTDRQRLRLPAGTLAQLEPNEPASLSSTPTADIGGWREGRRLYLDAPLGQVIADLNRRYARPIRLADDETARIHFTGVLVLGSQDRTVHRLTALLPLNARVGSHSEIVLSSRRP